MERWLNKVAVVTGASSGIGLAIALKLLKHGMRVVALARREEKLKEIHDSLESDLKVKFYSRNCDVSQEDQVREVFKWIKENLGGVDILVNNAGINGYGKLTDVGESQNMRNIMNTNVMGAIYCTQEAFTSMKERNFDGHVIIISSVAAHKISYGLHVTNIYAASKFALKALVELYRQEFNDLKTKVKITSISPGMVETEMTTELKMLPSLYAEDIADAAIYAIGTPPHVQKPILGGSIELINKFSTMKKKDCKFRSKTLERYSRHF